MEMVLKKSALSLDTCCKQCNSLLRSDSLIYRLQRIFKLSLSVSSSYLILFLFALLYIPCSFGCNIDESKPTRYFGTPGDYFGYQVLQFQTPISKSILVGAPRANSSDHPNLIRPGGLWRCPVVSPLNCDEVRVDYDTNVPERTDLKDNQWLGVSLTRVDSGVGVTVCGHRYANDFYVQDNSFDPAHERFLNGICYTITGSLEYESQKIVVRKDPCFGRTQTDGYDRVFGYCQAGMSVTYTSDDSLIYGAPGTFNWTGTTLTEGVNTPNTYTTTDGDSLWNANGKGAFSNVGYDVTSGNFLGPGEVQQIAVGAPRAESIGKVFLYSIDYATVYQEIYGEPMHSYFGSTVAAVDLNNDGYSDLLVGAPMYSSNEDEGKVYVYINKKTQTKPLELKFELYGSKGRGARFGTAISSAGDLNNDGFFDVIIGAPYEDDHAGAIYIYRGNADGINTAYAQRMTGSQFNPKIRTFGSSVTGGLDIDGNTYHDITVGAYESDTVLTFKTKPQIHLEAKLKITPHSIDPEIKNYQGNTRSYVSIQVCFNFTGLFITSNMEIEYSLTVDEEHRAQGLNSRFTFVDEFTTLINSSVNVRYENQEYCADAFDAFLAQKTRDFLTPVPLMLTYDVKKYEVETERRGDRPFKFPHGLPPVSDNYNCVPEVVTEYIRFVQDCGDDGECQTDLQLDASLELPAGEKENLIIGSANVIYAVAKINNLGEDAHQALLFLEHPTDFGYEGVEVEDIICIDTSGRNKPGCTPELLIICNPLLGDGGRAFVACSLGNPMQSYTSVIIRLRFDIGGIDFEKDRRPVFTYTIKTESIETELQKKNNEKRIEIGLRIEADLSIIGVSVPEQVNYGYNGTEYENNPSKVTQDKLEMSKVAVKRFYLDQSINDSWIGPNVNHVYQINNLGPGEMPLTSEVSIAVPWRLEDGAWLLFIKSIELKGGLRTQKCNEARILDLQKTRLDEFYNGQTSNVQAAAEESVTVGTADDPNQLGCSKARCVNITCPVDILDRNENVVIEIKAILWQHTFITRGYTFVELVSDASISVNDTTGIYNQPKDHEPDSTRLITLAYTGTMGTEPVKWWIILLAIIIGLLLLALAIFGLYKLGFFKRALKDARGNYSAAPTAE